MRSGRSPLDYYKILNVPYDASEEDIKSAYRRLAKQFHPDLRGSTDAENQMKLINEAYEVLGDKRRKAAYDFIFFGLGAHRTEREAPSAVYGPAQPETEAPSRQYEPSQPIPEPGFFQRVASLLVLPLLAIKEFDRACIVILLVIPQAIFGLLLSGGLVDSEDVFGAIALVAIVAYIYFVVTEIVNWVGIRLK